MSTPCLQRLPRPSCLLPCCRPLPSQPSSSSPAASIHHPSIHRSRCILDALFQSVVCLHPYARLDASPFTSYYTSLAAAEASHSLSEDQDMINHLGVQSSVILLPGAAVRLQPRFKEKKTPPAWLRSSHRAQEAKIDKPKALEISKQRTEMFAASDQCCDTITELQIATIAGNPLVDRWLVDYLFRLFSHTLNKKCFWVYVCMIHNLSRALKQYLPSLQMSAASTNILISDKKATTKCCFVT